MQNAKFAGKRTVQNEFNMLKISQLHIYPIKSLAGISVSSAEVLEKGFKNDRRFMLVDRGNRFLTIREFPILTRLQPKLEEDGITVISLDTDIDDLFIPFNHPQENLEKVTIWNAKVEASSVSHNANNWFSEVLKAAVKLMYMPQKSMRPVDTTSGYKPAGKFVSFADAYPFMMMGEASLTNLNERFEGSQKFTIGRFRPNIVFSGGFPNQEDEIESFTINDVAFTGLENCARCTIPNVNPEDGKVDEHTEPLATLSKYRLQNRKIYFGRNLVHSGNGTIHVGDILEFNERSKTILAINK